MLGGGVALALALFLLLRRPAPPRETTADDEAAMLGAYRILDEPAPALPVRSLAERIASAVALEPDPVELFAIVAEEVGVELRIPAVTLVRFETGGFGTVVGAWHAEDELDVAPGTTVDLDASSPAGQVYASGKSVPGGAPIRIGTKPWGVLVGEGRGSRPSWPPSPRSPRAPSRTPTRARA